MPQGVEREHSPKRHMVMKGSFFEAEPSRTDFPRPVRREPWL